MQSKRQRPGLVVIVLVQEQNGESCPGKSLRQKRSVICRGSPERALGSNATRTLQQSVFLDEDPPSRTEEVDGLIPGPHIPGWRPRDGPSATRDPTHRLHDFV